MRRAADAGVVAPDQLFEQMGDLVLRPVEDRRREQREVRLDGRLVLARRRDDPRWLDWAVRVQRETLEQRASWRLRRPRRNAGPRRPGDDRALGRFVCIDDVDRLGDGVYQFDGSGRDTPVRFVRDLVAEIEALQRRDGPRMQ